MIITDQNRQLWLDLYEAAVAFRDARPWEWLYDSDLFAVVDPLSGERQFCCVMGNAGEVFALAVYSGPEGLATYDALVTVGEESNPALEEGLDQAALVVSFENRDELTDADRKQIKALGLQFRGDHQWVQFRRHDPGYLPWYISDAEAARLVPVLQQAIPMAEEIRTDHERYMDLQECPVRIQGEDGWATVNEPWPEPPEEVSLSYDSARVENILAELPRVKGALCLGTTYLPSAIMGEESARPFFAYVILWIDYSSGAILGNELFGPGELEDRFVDWFLQSLRELEVIPQQIGLNSRRLYRLLADLGAALDIELLLIPEEPVLEETISSLLSRVG